MSLNDLSFSDRSGAVLSPLLYACVLSESICLLSGEVSLGLCSSPRIDLVLPNKLNGFGLFFFSVECEDCGSVVGFVEELDFDGAPTALLVTDLSGESVRNINN